MVILAEFGQDWYFGHTVANEAHKGIFPRDFVYITSSARAVESQEPLVEEINSSLKEWNAIMKTKYVNFDNLEVNIIVGKISKCSTSLFSQGRFHIQRRQFFFVFFDPSPP